MKETLSPDLGMVRMGDSFIGREARKGARPNGMQ